MRPTKIKVGPKSVEVAISHQHVYDMRKPADRERYSADRAEALKSPGRSNPKAAWTTAVVTVGENEFKGAAYCSILDTFNRHRGVQVSLARALSGSGLSKDERRVVWEKVFSGKYSPEAK